jgi:hypothetical protein
MTEQEWLVCQDPRSLFTFVEKNVLSHSRKTRLLAVAACDQVWSLLTDERSRSAVRLAERLADNNATEQERIEPESSARTAVEMVGEHWRNADDGEIPGAGVGYCHRAPGASPWPPQPHPAAADL